MQTTRNLAGTLSQITLLNCWCKFFKPSGQQLFHLMCAHREVRDFISVFLENQQSISLLRYLISPQPSHLWSETLYGLSTAETERWVPVKANLGQLMEGIPPNITDLFGLGGGLTATCTWKLSKNQA